jgi:membrane-associated phospholipid phosphatase
MHYISDVVAGLLLGATWLFVALRGIRLGVLHHQLRAHDPGRRRRSASAMARGESTR